MARRKTADSFRVEETKAADGAAIWVVHGWTLDGRRIRERHRDARMAIARRNEIESLWLERDIRAQVRVTWLSIEQLKEAEAAMTLLPEAGDLMRATQTWLKQGLRHGPIDGPRFDAAVDEYLKWIAGDESQLRPKTVESTTYLVRNFERAADNPRLCDIDAVWVQSVIVKRWENVASRDHVRRIASGFFSWCMMEPRRWIDSNPASGKIIRFRKPPKQEPGVLRLRECARLLVACRRYYKGRFLRSIVLQLFCGMRRRESGRVTNDQINLTDGEIRLRGDQAKTKGRGRTIRLMPVARAWLAICPKHSIDPETSSDQWEIVRRRAKCTRWPRAVLRHTAISHFFRATGSYGETAEWAGNSEPIIKAHYQGRVNSEETRAFWSMFPTRRQRAAARTSRASG